MKPSPRILISRLSAIGDVIHTLPVACALRERFPDAWLTWVIGEPSAGLLRGHEVIDEVIALPRGWLKSPRTVWQLRQRLRAQDFDLAIDAQGLTKSAIITWLSGCRRRIGFGNPWGRELSRWLNNDRVDTTAEHAIDRNLQLLRPLGIEWSPVHFRLAEMADDRAVAQRILHDCGLEGRFAIIHAGAGWPSKLWPTERYAAVARHLGRSRNLPMLVTFGSEPEREMADQIAAGSRGHAQVAPSMTLAQLAAVSRRAQFFLGSDTGPLHLAAAVETPCVGLYGPWPAERHGPYGTRHVVLQKMVCPGSTRRRRHASSKYMEAIDVPSVVAACEKILRRYDRTAA